MRQYFAQKGWEGILNYHPQRPCRFSSAWIWWDDLVSPLVAATVALVVSVSRAPGAPSMSQDERSSANVMLRSVAVQSGWNTPYPGSQKSRFWWFWRIHQMVFDSFLYFRKCHCQHGRWLMKSLEDLQNSLQFIGHTHTHKQHNILSKLRLTSCWKWENTLRFWVTAWTCLLAWWHHRRSYCFSCVSHWGNRRPGLGHKHYIHWNWNAGFRFTSDTQWVNIDAINQNNHMINWNPYLFPTHRFFGMFLHSLFGRNHDGWERLCRQTRHHWASLLMRRPASIRQAWMADDGSVLVDEDHHVAQVKWSSKHWHPSRLPKKKGCVEYVFPPCFFSRWFQIIFFCFLPLRKMIHSLTNIYFWLDSFTITAGRFSV